MSEKPPEEQNGPVQGDQLSSAAPADDLDKPEDVLAEFLMEGQALPGGNARARMVQLFARAALHVGPLPPAEELSKYEQVLPGVADRIVAMAEKEQAHRHGMQDVRTKAAIRDSGRGVVFAFILCLAAIAGGSITAIVSAPLAGGAIALGGLASLAGTFIYGTRLKRSAKTSDQSPSKPSSDSAPDDGS